METNSVSLCQEVDQEVNYLVELAPIDEAIQKAAQQYIDLQTKSREYLAKAGPNLFSGTEGTIYLKLRGHRSLTADDFESLINAFGTEEDKKTLVDFAAAQLSFNERLSTTRARGLVLEQSGITRDLMYKRAKRPDLWKADELIRVVEVLKRLQV